MSIENVKAYLNEKGIGDSYIEFPGSSATVTLAAEQLRCEPDRIAKSLAIKLKSGRLLVIVVSGESKLDNSKSFLKKLHTFVLLNFFLSFTVIRWEEFVPLHLRTMLKSFWMKA